MERILVRWLEIVVSTVELGSSFQNEDIYRTLLDNTRPCWLILKTQSVFRPSLLPSKYDFYHAAFSLCRLGTSFERLDLLWFISFTFARSGSGLESHVREADNYG